MVRHEPLQAAILVRERPTLGSPIGLHPAGLATPAMKGGLGDPVFPQDLRDWQPDLRFLQDGQCRRRRPIGLESCLRFDSDTGTRGTNLV